MCDRRRARARDATCGGITWDYDGRELRTDVLWDAASGLQLFCRRAELRSRVRRPRGDDRLQIGGRSLAGQYSCTLIIDMLYDAAVIPPAIKIWILVKGVFAYATPSAGVS